MYDGVVLEEVDDSDEGSEEETGRWLTGRA